MTDTTRSTRDIRTREAISALDYNDLARLGVVPELRPYVPEYPSKRYPKPIYSNVKAHSNIFSYFGVFMENIIQIAIEEKIPTVNHDTRTSDRIEQLMDIDPNRAADLASCLVRVQDKSISVLNKLNDIWKLTSLFYLYEKTNYINGQIITQLNIPPKIDIDWNSSRNFFSPIVSLYQTIFIRCCNTSNVEFGKELKYLNLVGHPDIVSSTTVMDVKNHAGFKVNHGTSAKDKKDRKNAEDAFLQVLAYVALSRAEGKNINYASILLPMQRDILTFNLVNWNSTSFLSYLMREVEAVREDEKAIYPSVELTNTNTNEGVLMSKNLMGTVGRLVFHPYIGTHVSRDSVKGLYTSLGIKVKSNMNLPEMVNGYLDTRQGLNSLGRNAGNSIQIFLTPRGDGDPSFTPEDLDMVNMLLRINNLRLFVHAPYTINLCLPQNDQWDLIRLRNDLVNGNRAGAEGVVVHVGKHKNMLNLNEAYSRMEQSIKNVLESATERCPLLLETCVGAGTEIGYRFSDFSDFYNRFTSEEKKRFKICLDTCHVSSAGYSPNWFFFEWLKIHPNSIGLVHFNDSSTERGSKVDKHMTPGLGHIGYLRLHEILLECIKLNIPMVQE